jgi:hypothetical protein
VVDFQYERRTSEKEERDDYRMEEMMRENGRQKK